jgi:hypothetical protein
MHTHTPDPPLIEPETLGSLFDASMTYSVPPYQRAYSWEDKHIDQFLEDLNEHPPRKPYYLGHFLLERKAESELFVIDGQQRLSTVVLLIGAVCRLLVERAKPDEAQELSMKFLEREGRFRFLTVPEDVDLFHDLATTGSPKTHVSTRSQKRIHDAYERLLKHLKALELEALRSLVSVISGAHITRMVVGDKVQATQIFTLQNSRGKDLTELEKLKAYLMYQVYLHSPENRENQAITSIERQFVIIYTTAERIRYLKEDQVLRHHDRAYSRHWEGPVENLKLDLGKLTDSAAVITHITDHCKSLAATFQHVEKLEKLLSHQDVIADLVILSAADSWPLLIKLYAAYGDQMAQDPVLIELLKNTEITLVKFHFLHGRSSNDLVSYAKKFGSNEHTLEWLTTRMRQTAKQGFRPRGNFSDALLDYLRGDYHYHKISRYILWKYENAKRHPKDHQVTPGEYLNEIAHKSMDATIEHVAPQQPQGPPYSEEFVTRFLNNLGNLLFMPQGMNSSQGNRPPAEKAAELGNFSFASYREVAERIRQPCHEDGCNDVWCGHKILARKQLIIDFAIERWKTHSEQASPITLA